MGSSTPAPIVYTHYCNKCQKHLCIFCNSCLLCFPFKSQCKHCLRHQAHNPQFKIKHQEFINLFQSGKVERVKWRYDNKTVSDSSIPIFGSYNYKHLYLILKVSYGKQSDKFMVIVIDAVCAEYKTRIRVKYSSLPQNFSSQRSESCEYQVTRQKKSFRQLMKYIDSQNNKQFHIINNNCVKISLRILKYLVQNLPENVTKQIQEIQQKDKKENKINGNTKPQKIAKLSGYKILCNCLNNVQ